jgi:hypothetical protein
MKALIITLLIAALSIAASVDIGIGVGTELQVNDIQPVPLLTIGSTIGLGNEWSICTYAGAVGYSDGYEYHAVAGAGYGPVRLGVAVVDDDDGKIVSYVGFEPVLNDYGRITCRVLDLEGTPVSTMGLTLTL